MKKEMTLNEMICESIKKVLSEVTERIDIEDALDIIDRYKESSDSLITDYEIDDINNLINRIENTYNRPLRKVRTECFIVSNSDLYINILTPISFNPNNKERYESLLPKGETYSEYSVYADNKTNRLVYQVHFNMSIK